MKIAIILALINIVASAILGFHVRYVNSREWYLKILGALCLTALVMYIPLNLFVGHFRDAAFALHDIDSITLQQAIERQSNLFPDAKAAFISRPLGLASPESWGLFLLGCLFAAISAVDGYKFDERLPGFSRLHKRLAALREELDSTTGQGFAELNDYEEAVQDSLSSAQERFEAQHRSFSNYCALCETVENVYTQQCEDYRRAYEALIHLYRAENRLKRTDGLAPSYFSKPATPLNQSKLEVDLEHDKKVLDEYQRIARDSGKLVSEARAEIHKHWKSVSDQLRR